MNWQRNSEIRELVDAHREWTRETIVAKLREAGAGFVPDLSPSAEAFFAPRLARLEPFVGRVRIESIELPLRHDAQLKAGFNSASLNWLVVFTRSKETARRKRAPRISSHSMVSSSP